MTCLRNRDGGTYRAVTSGSPKSTLYVVRPVSSGDRGVAVQKTAELASG